MRLYERQTGGTVVRARQLRREASEPERRLLRGLREAFPSLKWRHQTPIGPFYADILCFSAKLVIEVDGDTHSDAGRYDAARTHFIEQEGYYVIRFANADVMQNLEGVLEHVSPSLGNREETRSAQPSGKGEGDSRQGKGDAA